MKKVLFFKNALILTVTALLLRVAGIFFRVWMASHLGAEGMGLYQVIFSVYTLASTFATSGLSTAITRLLTERLAVGDLAGAKRTLRYSLALSLAVALLSVAIVFGFSRPIALIFIGDARAEASLKILSFSLPFMGVCSCLRGYFLARRNTLPPSIGQIFEQIVRMSMIVLLVQEYAKYGLAAASAAVLTGDTLAEAAGTFLLWLFYRLDIRRKKATRHTELTRRKTLGELVRISAPITLGRYLHTGLRTSESLLTPLCLSRYAGSKTMALEQFGMIKGMALPLLLFPASLLSSVSTLLIPEMSEAMANGSTRSIRAAVDKVLSITSLLSFPIAGVFLVAAGPMGRILYQSDSVGYLLRALAPLVPFMYIDLIADGVLKGLDQQNILFRNNVADSVIRLLLVVLLVPRFGMQGFLGVMLFSNLFTAVLSVVRMVRVAGLGWDTTRYVWRPLAAVGAAVLLSDFLCRPLHENDWLFLVVAGCTTLLFYLVFLILFGGLSLGPFFRFIGRKTPNTPPKKSPFTSLSK